MKRQHNLCYFQLRLFLNRKHRNLFFFFFTICDVDEDDTATLTIAAEYILNYFGVKGVCLIFSKNYLSQQKLKVEINIFRHCEASTKQT